MDIAAAHTLFDALAGDRSSFLYSGSFPDDHTARLITLGEGFLNGQAARRGQMSRLAFVMVEAYQNIIRHRAKDPGADVESTRSFFGLRCGEGWQDVLSVNPVSTEKVPALRELLARIKELDGSQLKELFLRGLQAQNTGRRGAGLGLIEMARRSGHALQYELTPLKGDQELFALRVRLGDAAISDGGVAMHLHSMMTEHGIVLLHRGSASATVQETFLRILEAETGGHNSTMARTYLAAMEHLGECPHRSAQAMVMITGRAKTFSLSIAHALTEEETAGFEKQLETVRSMDMLALSHKYREDLLRRTRGDEVKGLGLMDLARHASGPLEYQAVGRRHAERFAVITARA